MSSGKYKIQKTLHTEKRRQICEKITRDLPAWFGREDANQQYFEDARKHTAIAAFDQDNAIGLLVYKEEFESDLYSTVLNIHWLGVLRSYHRQGVGKILLKKLIEIGSNRNVDTVTVETLDPEVKNDHYLKTYNFYKACGFKIFNQFEEKGTKMVRMVKGNSSAQQP